MNSRDNNNSFIKSSVLTNQKHVIAGKKHNQIIYCDYNSKTFPSLKQSVTPQKNKKKYLNISSESISNISEYKRINTILPSLGNINSTEPNKSQSKTSFMSKKGNNVKHKKKHLNKSAIINNHYDFSNKKKKKTVYNSTKTVNNITTTTSASNNNYFPKSYSEIINTIERNYFGIWFSKDKNAQGNKFINEISKKLNLNIIYISQDKTKVEYEKTINLFSSNNLFFFVLFENKNEMVNKFKILNENVFILCNKNGKNVFSFCYDETINKEKIEREISKFLNESTLIENNPLYEEAEKIFIEIIQTLEENEKQFLCVNDIIALYYPNCKEEKKENILRNEKMLEELYIHSNLYEKQFEIITISPQKQKYWINIKNFENFSEKLRIFQSSLIIFDKSYKLLSLTGINDILHYQYKTFDYWSGLINNTMPNNETNLSFCQEYSSIIFTDYTNNIVLDLEKRDFTLLNFYPQNPSKTLIQELENIFICLKNKIVFIHISYSNLVNSDEKQNCRDFKFGTYAQCENSDLLSTLLNDININISSFSPSIIIFSNNTKKIINWFPYTELSKGLYPLMDKWLSPYNYLHNKSKEHTHLNIIEKIIKDVKTKLPFQTLTQYDFLFLYFNETSNMQYKKNVNLLNELYYLYNKIGKRIEIIFIPYEQNLSYRNYQSLFKEITFLLCEYGNIKELYKRYNPNKTFPKLIAIDRYGTILEENLLTKLENKGEVYLNRLLYTKLRLKPQSSLNSLIHLSFLGKEFDYDNQRITRSDFNKNAKFIGLTFVASWCMLTDDFLSIIKSMIQNNNFIEIIINNVEEDKNSFTQYNKYLNHISIPFDFKNDLPKFFNILEIGIPSLFLFDIDTGNFLNYFDVDNINNLNQYI